MFVSEREIHLSMTDVICYGVVMGLYVLLYSFFSFYVSGLLRSRCLFPGSFLMRSNYLGEYFFHYPTKIAFLQKLDKI